jgi:transglutaminase-like putative cysteine protease
MHRRSLLAAAGALPFLPLAPTGALAQAATRLTTPDPAQRWRFYEITYAVTLPTENARTRLWLPLPHEARWQRLDSMSWTSNAPQPGLYKEPTRGVAAFYAEWPEGGPERTAEVRLRIATLNRQVTPRHGMAAEPIPSDVAYYLKPSSMIQTDGIVKRTADQIVGSSQDPLEKAQKVFDWVSDNTFRDPQVKGCGIGDIKGMLTTGNLGGKCADLNALFVGLCRAAGVPARGVYGVRLSPSVMFPAMGAAGPDISKAQHCRAEFWIAGAGWVPADPADVRKVILDNKVALDDPRLKELRGYVVGSWEGNWMAFNTERDVKLPPTGHGPVNFFMYPEAMTAKGELDGIDPEVFGYKITARPVTA